MTWIHGWITEQVYGTYTQGPEGSGGPWTRSSVRSHSHRAQLKDYKDITFTKCLKITTDNMGTLVFHRLYYWTFLAFISLNFSHYSVSVRVGWFVFELVMFMTDSTSD